jgi:hypothetical protein
VFPNLNKIQPAKILDDIKKYGVTFIGGSPAFTYKLACHAAKLGISLPVKATSVGGAPVYRGMLRTIASVTPEKKAMLLYGSTEVEPVSVIFADEKLQLEAGKPDGHCVGRPVFEDSARVISILSGRLMQWNLSIKDMLGALTEVSFVKRLHESISI